MTDRPLEQYLRDLFAADPDGAPALRDQLAAIQPPIARALGSVLAKLTAEQQARFARHLGITGQEGGPECG